MGIERRKVTEAKLIDVDVPLRPKELTNQGSIFQCSEVIIWCGRVPTTNYGYVYDRAVEA